MILRNISDCSWSSCTSQSVERDLFSPLRRLRGGQINATPEIYQYLTGFRSNGSVVPQQVDAKEAWGSAGWDVRLVAWGSPMRNKSAIVPSTRISTLSVRRILRVTASHVRRLIFGKVANHIRCMNLQGHTRSSTWQWYRASRVPNRSSPDSDNRTVKQ